MNKKMQEVLINVPINRMVGVCVVLLLVARLRLVVAAVVGSTAPQGALELQPPQWRSFLTLMSKDGYTTMRHYTLVRHP
jgi:hypothetical protein